MTRKMGNVKDINTPINSSRNSTGEPCAMKVARTVREGLRGKVVLYRKNSPLFYFTQCGTGRLRRATSISQRGSVCWLSVK